MISLTSKKSLSNKIGAPWWDRTTGPMIKSHVPLMYLLYPLRTPVISTILTGVLNGYFFAQNKMKGGVQDAKNVRNRIDSERIGNNRISRVRTQMVEIRPRVQAHKKEKRAVGKLASS